MSSLAQQQSRPQLVTNEASVVEATRPATFDVKDPMAVLAYVLASLPERVTVYPTENYYYFKFVHAGVPIAGNIRLDPRDRDKGKVYFGYYEDNADWKKDGFEQGLELDGKQNVLVERVEPLVYRISYQGTSVLFALNDVSQIKPPPGAIGPDERLIGPVFDESAVRFFLVYNSKAKVFHYVLDETAPVPDGLEPSPRSDRILVGKRTGFAYYRDHRLDRKILIGVFEQNVRLNNYFDGPFDQLPDNFIEGETLAAGDHRQRPGRQRHDRPARVFCEGRYPLRHQSLYAVPQRQRPLAGPSLRHRPEGPRGGLLPLLRDGRHRSAYGRPAGCAPRVARQVQIEVIDAMDR